MRPRDALFPTQSKDNYGGLSIDGSPNLHYKRNSGTLWVIDILVLGSLAVSLSNFVPDRRLVRLSIVYIYQPYNPMADA